jgi:hypothetical protein
VLAAAGYLGYVERKWAELLEYGYDSFGLGNYLSARTIAGQDGQAVGRHRQGHLLFIHQFNP